jgi:uncharacterized protein (DUF427 family)
MSSIDNDDLLDARGHWQWRGQARPPFAAVPAPGQASVWDFPRPPRLVADPREIVIAWGGVEIARATHTIRVMETAHPPSFYLPWSALRPGCLEPAEGSSLCEWKGPARYWTLVLGDRRLARVAWGYPRPLEGAEILADRIAFYPHPELECSVGGLAATPQPGGFYGGWITPELTGPFKGEPGSEGW